jgi:hypothetical protein
MQKNYLAQWVFFTIILSGLAGCMEAGDRSGVRLPSYVFATQTPEPREVTIVPALYEGYLANPGIGWQRDNSTYSSYIPETVVYAERAHITWRILNPQDGVYNWLPLDEAYHRAMEDGKQFSFRVFTMAGEIYGGHEVPDWVLERGANLLWNGEPDYSSCVYQEEWGRFVNALLERYDGQPGIVYMDISGYGNFNEWSWSDEQTEWDFLWEEAYNRGTATQASMTNLDAQARRRLADIFLGGSFQGHQCRAADGRIQTLNYSYLGAQKTQLVMPYAGTVQSTQYVFTRRNDVGFRFDCLGRGDDLPLEAYQIWLNAPVVYEFCGPEGFSFEFAWRDMRETHPALIHNNAFEGDPDELQEFMLPIGYRFFLKEATADYSVRAGQGLSLSMSWQNLGSSPIYPKMGHDFTLHIYDITQWLPAHPFSVGHVPEYKVDLIILIPRSLPVGDYALAGAIVNNITGLPLQLAVEGEYIMGKFVFFDISVD